MSQSTSDSYFEQLKAKNPVRLPPEKFDELARVMRKLRYDDFRSYEQGLITLKFLKGENVFGVLPTGSGKSFTFQTVARLTDGLTIVISPLIALMKDQVGKHKDGMALYFNSELPDEKKRAVKRRIRKGQVRLLYISPERLKSTDFKDLLASSRQRVKRIVIDEAHCVIEWGYGFRTKYLHIAQEIEEFEKQSGERIPILLLTATASPWLQKEIVQNLQVRVPESNYVDQKAGADRPELRIRLLAKPNNARKLGWLAKQLKPGGKLHNKRGIIFSMFATKGDGLGAENAETICEKLTKAGVRRIQYYHGAMDLDGRRQIQEDFKEQRFNILVATKAFGMGVDLPKLDFIIHFYPPISLEQYWQEIGRGGRDMKAGRREFCECVLLHADDDYDKLGGFPNLASFAKTLSTFATAVRGEVWLDEVDIAEKGKLRKLLGELRRSKAIKRLPSQRVAGVTFERWKLCKPVGRVVRHIESLMDEENWKSKQVKRLRSNLRIHAAKKGTLVRVPQSTAEGKPGLEYYDKELNWLTEPGIDALEMVDVEWENDVPFTCFRLLKSQLSREEMSLLARKINSYRRLGYAKLNYVFERLLKAKRGKEKEVILKYLAASKPPV